MTSTTRSSTTRSSAARSSSRRSGGGSTGYAVFLLPGIVLSVIVLVIPMLMNISFSFTRWSGVGKPQWIGLANYDQLIHDQDFWASFEHIGGLIIALAVVPTLLGLVIAALLFDYLSKRFGDRWATTLRSGLYLPQVLPVTVTGIVWSWLLNAQYGTVNILLKDIGLGSWQQDWLGSPHWALPSVMLVMVWFQVGYPVVMFMAGLQRIDPAIYEAANLDGASWLQRFRYITVHLIKPEIYVVLVTTTIAAMKIFGQIFVLTRGGPGNSTLVPSYFAYLNFFQKLNVGYGSAISTVLTVIIIVVTVVFLQLQNRSERRSGLGL
jgi:raffinose/stachyose/melibiose transport system permease protein